MAIDHDHGIFSALDGADKMKETTLVVQTRCITMSMPKFRFLTPVDAELLEDSQGLRGICAITSRREVETVTAATGFRRADRHTRESHSSGFRIALKFPSANGDLFHVYREEEI